MDLNKVDFLAVFVTTNQPWAQTIYQHSNILIVLSTIQVV